MTVEAPPKPAVTPSPVGQPPPGQSSAAPPAAPLAGAFIPKPPSTFAEAGLDPGVVEALILKYLMAVGSATGAAISEELCLPSDPIIEYLAGLKLQQIIVHVGASQVGDFTYMLTDAGRDRARRLLLESMYVGPAPVPLGAYIGSISAQTLTKLTPHEKELREAFSDLVITDEMFEILGPAINSGRGMFLYGSPGNGKTSIAERVTRCFGDSIYIPKCVIVDGVIIKLFDAAQHEPVEQKRSSIYKKDRADDRWIRIRRPTIIAGGELTLDALEVRYNPTSKTCEAPMQMKSNCGTLCIDDFGRQRIQPIELLNRWILPLEKRFDFLALPNGKKVQIPFDQLIIFSTNLEPKALCDEAFLRRIPYKINIPDPSEETFRKLFEFVGPRLGFKMDASAEAAVDHLIEKHYRAANRPFRCCQPRDMLMQVRNRCLYLGRPLSLAPELFDYAVSVYFTVM
jgi:predicted ATPase with chaperone activity